MYAPQILGVRWLKGAVAQIKAQLQFQPRHTFEAGQHQIRADFAFGNDTIVMRPVRARKHLPRCYGSPEPLVIVGGQPFFDVLNVFKNAHEDSLPNTTPDQQI